MAAKKVDLPPDAKARLRMLTQPVAGAEPEPKVEQAVPSEDAISTAKSAQPPKSEKSA